MSWTVVGPNTCRTGSGFVERNASLNLESKQASACRVLALSRVLREPCTEHADRIRRGERRGRLAEVDLQRPDPSPVHPGQLTRCQSKSSAPEQLAETVTVKLPSAATATGKNPVASLVRGEITTCVEAARPSAFVIVTELAPAAIALRPLGRLIVAAPGAPLESVIGIRMSPSKPIASFVVPLFWKRARNLVNRSAPLAPFAIGREVS